jgi:UDP-N-acetylmuramyl pentapeptide phosphotransferase/UDP-N-acetylglucosamine-1-phosphate transferase
MAIMGFGAYGVAALHAGAPAAAFFALAAATLPFYVVNRPRATMFLGDVGSVPLGFLAAAFGAAGALAGHWPAWFPALVFLPFVADATVTLARRALAGERVSEAHNDHHYQHLHRLGAGHAGTLGVYAGAMAVTAGTALGCLLLAPRAGEIALAVESVVCFILFGAIEHRWRKRLPASR